MFVPGIKIHGHANSEDDGWDYNYLMQFEQREAATKFAKDWATEKTPAQERNTGDIIPYQAKEWNGE